MCRFFYVVRHQLYKFILSIFNSWNNKIPYLHCNAHKKTIHLFQCWLKYDIISYRFLLNIYIYIYIYTESMTAVFFQKNI